MFRRLLLSLLRILLVVFVVIAALLFFLQGSMIYFPRAYGKGDFNRFSGLGGVSLAYETGEGKQVAFYLPPSQAPGKMPESLWLLCGGNASLTLDYFEVALRAGRDQGYLFVDLPGYGQSEGKPTPKSAAASVEGAVAALAQHLGSTPEALQPRFSAFGHSLGAAVVLRAAADMGMKRAVVVAPFTSIMDFARSRFGFPLCEVLRHRYDNRASLRDITAQGGRVTVFHGDADRDVPVQNSRTLAAEFPETIEYHEIPGTDHNGIIADIAKELGAAMRLPSSP